jgi:Xaa-Pro aminopeptidase
MAEPLYPDFPETEFVDRWTRARELMAKAGLDALFICGTTNYMYFTGHRSDQILADKVRPYVFLLPSDRDPLVFVMPFEQGHVELTTWVADIRNYQLFKHNDVFVNTLRQLGLANRRIGCELGREQYLGMTYRDFTDLMSMLPEATFVDASDILLTLRAIKSEAELERMRMACRITVRGFNRALDEVRVGMTVLEVAHLVRKHMIDEGAEQIRSLHLSSGYDFTRGKVTIPVPRRLEAGDTLTIDSSAQYRGYMSDITRTVAVGKASQRQKDMYRLTMDLNYVCYEALRPGNLCEDVALACQREAERLGRKTQAVGRIGHGVGADGVEYPSIAVGERLALEPGMVFACNPNFATEFGFFNIEENLVIRDDGNEFLSDFPIAPRELQVVG